MVTAASGMDILCHALESYTARWYADFDAKQPEQRVPYCGANPIADMWSEKAMTPAGRVVPHRGARRRRRRARASRWRWRPPSPASASATPGCTSRTPTPTRSPAGSATTGPTGYPDDEPIVPHGMAVVADRARGVPVHLRRRTRSGTCARPGSSTRTPRATDPTCSRGVAHRADARHRHAQRPRPRSGTATADVDDLVAGATQQQRLLATAPKAPTEDDLAAVFVASMEHW